MPHPLVVDPLTIYYNLVMIAADAALLLFVAKRPSVVSWLISGAVGIVLGVVLAGAISREEGFALIQFLSWLFFAHGFILLTGLAAVLWKSSRVLARVSLGIAIIVTAIGIDAFAIEPYRLELSTYEISSAKLQQRMRIVVIADLQTDVIGQYERDAMRLAMDQKPDLILFAGDYLQQSPLDPQLVVDFRQLLREVRIDAPLGVFAVKGDVDQAGWQTLFEGFPITVLADNQTRRLGAFNLTGLTLLSSRRMGNSGFLIPETDEFHIVLGHAPDFALGSPPADLLVAGHTHGGQVQLPFIGPLITMSRVPRAWAAGGLTQLAEGRHLLVSRGVGMERDWAPRLRFLCRPQLVVIDVKPA